MTISPLPSAVYAAGPTANPYSPRKDEIIALLNQLVAGLSSLTSGAGSVAKETRAALYADLTAANGAMAWVWNDPTTANNGVYVKSGASGTGSWSRILSLPYSYVAATDTGTGTANAIKAVTDIPVSEDMLIWIELVNSSTTEPVTISFNNDIDLTIKTNRGTNASALTSGMVMVGKISGSTFRLWTDEDIAALVDQAEAARDAAAAAALSVASYIQSPLKVSFYCQGDGTNEDTKFSQFLAELQDKGVDGVIDLPVRLASSKTLTGYMATLKAAGEGRLTFTGGTNGLIVDNSGITSFPINVFGWDGLGLYTETDGVGIAFQFKASVAGGENLVPSVDMERPLFHGIDPSKGWSKGAIFDHIMQSTIRNASIRGRATLNPGCMVSGIEFVNGCNVVDIIDLRADWGETGVLVKDQGIFSEGIRMYAGYVRAMKTGFQALATGQYHSVKGTHFDTSRAGVVLGVDGVVGSNFSSVEDCFFLRSGAELWGSNEYFAVMLNNTFSAARGNRIWLDGALDSGGTSRQNKSYGVIVGSLTDTTKSGMAVVTDNIIAGCTIPVNLRPNTFGCNVKANVIDAYGNTGMTVGGIKNDGFTQVTAGNMVRNSSGAITVTT